MSKVIAFLEALGEGTGIQGEAGFEERLASLEIDEELRTALRLRDHAALNKLLGGRENVFCLLVPAEEDDKQEDDAGDEDREKENIRAA